MSDVQPLTAGLRPTREGRAYQRGFRAGHEAAREVADALAAQRDETIRELKAALERMTGERDNERAAAALIGLWRDNEAAALTSSEARR